MHRLLLLVILLLLCNDVSAHAKEGTFIREERRKILPVEKLIVNLESEKMEKLKQPERVMDVFGAKKGEVIADIGAGTGYYSFRLASRVGGEGKVYAAEIEDGLLDFIRNKMLATDVTNVVPIKSSDIAPNLPTACCDKIIFTNSYYYLKDPVQFMKNTMVSLKPGGLVGIIDLDAAKAHEKSKMKDKLSFQSEVIKDMKSAGLVLRESHDFLKARFFLIFGVAE